MDSLKLFTIGEVAGMFHLSAGSLRHYEQAGLLKPERIDPDTGYRYYSVRQFEVLNTIRYLRVLDMPLSQIRDFLQNRDIDRMEEMLKRQRETVVRKQQELAAVEQKIGRRLSQIRDARASVLDQIWTEKTPSCRMVQIRDSLSPRTYLDLEYSIRKLEEDQKESLAFLGKVGVGIFAEHLNAGRFDSYDLVFLILDEEDHYEGEIQTLPEGECVCVRFCGGHSGAAVYYEKLAAYIRERHMEISGCSREITMIDDGMTADPEQFVTEIRIPVRAAKA